MTSPRTGLRLIYSAHALNRLASFVAFFLPVFLVEEPGFTVAQASQVLVALGIGAVLGQVFAGAVLDRVGARVSVMVALPLGGLGTLALLAPLPVTAMSGCAALAGAGAAGYRPALRLAVTKLAPQAQWPSAFGVLQWFTIAGALVSSTLGIGVETVRRDPATRGFVVQPRRWVVERTFGRLMHHRRLARDYEALPARSEAMVHVAMISVMTRRLTGENTPTWRGT